MWEKTGSNSNEEKGDTVRVKFDKTVQMRWMSDISTTNTTFFVKASPS